MNTVYKILWIDDSEDFLESTEELIMDVVNENNMLPEIQPYVDYEEFKEKELDKFDADVFNQYDQIVVDYALSGITGDRIIRDIRARNIYTDIVFYSSEFDKMRQEMKKTEQLDGVFFADRSNLTAIIDRVIKKNLRREYDISNIRGLIMDNSSEFDYICRTTAVALFELLCDDKKEKIEKSAREFVADAKQRSEGNFSVLEKKTGTSYVKKAIENVEYVMSNKARYQLMAMILREFDFAQDVPVDLADQYDVEVIQPRNKLAHSKLFYGECMKKLHISKRRQILKCNEDCEHCKSAYSIDTCEELRNRLFYYYQLFQNINKRVSEYLETNKQLQGV